MPAIHLKQFLLDKQADLGRKISQDEIAEATNLSPNTIGRLLNHRVSRIDENTIFALCEFFGVEEGDPVPFIIYDPTVGATK